jgi:hypothetical protein
MVDAETGRRFQIFLQGHPKFMTRAAQRKVLASKMLEAGSFGAFTASDGKQCSVDETAMAMASSEDPRQRRKARAQARNNPALGIGKLMGSRNFLPVSEMTDQRDTLMLRIRAFPGQSLPEFSDGEVIVGCTSSVRRREAQGEDAENDSPDDASDHSDEDGEQYLPKTTRSFRILDVSWGSKAYANLEVDGASSRTQQGGSTCRSKSDKNCFCVCREIKLAGF